MRLREYSTFKDSRKHISGCRTVLAQRVLIIITIAFANNSFAQKAEVGLQGIITTPVNDKYDIYKLTNTISIRGTYQVKKRVFAAIEFGYSSIGTEDKLMVDFKPILTYTMKGGLSIIPLTNWNLRLSIMPGITYVSTLYDFEPEGLYFSLSSDAQYLFPLSKQLLIGPLLRYDFLDIGDNKRVDNIAYSREDFHGFGAGVSLVFRVD